MDKIIQLPSHGLSALMPKAAPPAPESKALIMSYPASMFWNSALEPYNRNDDVIRGIAAFRAFWLSYSCMSYRSTKLQEAPLWIREEKDGDESWLAGDHPLAELLESPNPDMEMSDLIETISLYLDATGACLLTKIRDGGQRVRMMYPFAKDEFHIEQGRDRMFGKFVVQTSKGQKEYLPEDVIHIRNIDPGNLLGATSPLDAALAHVNIGNSLKNAVVAQLRNKIRPGAIASFPNAVEDDEFERYKAEIASMYQGVRNDGRTLFLDAGGKLDILSGSLKELEFGPVSGDVEVAICSAFKVHPLIIGARIGLEASSGFADTLKPATALFYDVAAIPTWVRIERALTRGLLREIDPNPLRFIRFDTTHVRALQADMTERTQEAANAGKYWTIDERRAHTGKEPLPEDDPRGDAFDSPAISLANAQISDGGPGGGGEDGKERSLLILTSKSATRAQKRDARARLWRIKFDVKARRDEDAYAKAARAQFLKEKADVLRILRESGDDIVQGALAAMKRNYKRDGQYYLDWIERYEKLVSRTIDVAGSDLAAEVGFDFNLNNPHVQAEILNRVNKLAGRVTRTTYNSISAEVSAGTRAGEGMSDIAKRIQEVFSSSDERATLIARTETIGALNAGEQIAARESGLELSKEWLSQGDDRVRDSHQEIDGDRVKLDEPFRNGLMHPGDQSGPPEEICNCRCGVLYHDEA